MAEISNNFYGPFIGFIFTFNLIVGTGALALPKAFSITGWALGIISLLLIALFGYICATYVVEVLALANISISKLDEKKEQLNYQDNTENQPLLNHGGADVHQNPSLMYIKQKFELGEMASQFLGNFGKILFYLCLTLYLYGDLSIYLVAISQTLTDITCNSQKSTAYAAKILDKDCLLFSSSIRKINLYRIYLVMFGLGVLPFVFYNIQKTRYLQIFTTFARWFAFVAMIALSASKIVGDRSDPVPSVLTNSDHTVILPAPWNLRHLPSLFGVAVYSFMCHHSIPSLLSPMILKRVSLPNLLRRGYAQMAPTSILLTPALVLAATYLVVFVFYVTLSTLAVFAFPTPGTILDLYTLNFVTATYKSKAHRVVGYFLALFPALALATTFPILAVTLRNNLVDLLTLWTTAYRRPSTLASNVLPNEAPGPSPSHLLNRWFGLDPVQRRRNSKLALAIVTCLVPPFLISWFAPDNLHTLVSLTGAFPGIAIQCLFPALLVYKARAAVGPRLTLNDADGSSNGTNSFGGQGGSLVEAKNPYASPFKSKAWLILTLLWVVVCVTLVALHLIADDKV